MYEGLAVGSKDYIIYAQQLTVA